MPGRLHLQEGQPARIEPDPSSDQVATAITQSRRKGVTHVTTPSPRQILDFLHRKSSTDKPSLPLSMRRAGRIKKAAKIRT